MLRQQKKHQCLNEDEKKINFHTTTTENKTKKDHDQHLSQYNDNYNEK